MIFYVATIVIIGLNGKLFNEYVLQSHNHLVN